MPRRRVTDAVLARRIWRDATAPTKRGSPVRRVMARRVLDAVFERALAEDPKRVRRWTQDVIETVYRHAREGDAKSAALYRECAPMFRAQGFAAPALPGDDE